MQQDRGKTCRVKINIDCLAGLLQAPPGAKVADAWIEPRFGEPSEIVVLFSGVGTTAPLMNLTCSSSTQEKNPKITWEEYKNG